MLLSTRVFAAAAAGVLGLALTASSALEAVWKIAWLGIPCGGEL
jgi:hypothetical protein